MGLASLTRPELIFPDLPGSDRPTVLRALAERVASEGLVDDVEALYRKLWEREELGSTGIGSGVAIPHCKLAELEKVSLAIGISRDGVEFGAVDGREVRLFFLLVSPEESPADHLQSLAAISKWVKVDRHVERIVELDDRGEIYRLLEEEGG